MKSRFEFNKNLIFCRFWTPEDYIVHTLVFSIIWSALGIPFVLTIGLHHSSHQYAEAYWWAIALWLGPVALWTSSMTILLIVTCIKSILKWWELSGGWLIRKAEANDSKF